eukprot:gene6241-2542_t
MVNPAREAQPRQIFLRFQGALLDGRVFDQTPEGEDAKAVKLADTQMPGLAYIIAMFCEGDQFEVVIPPHLAFGWTGRVSFQPVGIAPWTPLHFNISLDRVDGERNPDFAKK